MTDGSDDVTRESAVGRRSFLGVLGTSPCVSLLGTGTAAADGDTERGYEQEYEHVVDVVEAGADPDGEEPITPVLRDVVGDDTLLQFPDGRYLMDEQLRFTDFEHFGMVGEDGAELVPAPADEYSGEARMFKLGTHYDPGRGLRIENFSIDFTAANTGLRALQVQVADGVRIRDVRVDGRHDAGTWGPFQVDVVDPDGSGVVEGVGAPAGGAYTENTAGDAEPTVETGPTGFLLSRYHEGRLVLRNVRLGPFPDNGLYVSGDAGRVEVEGGEFRNSNVASIRLAGDGSTVRGATVVVDHNRPEDELQRGIRLDGGADLAVRNVVVSLRAPNGEAVAVTSAVESARIAGSSVTILDEVNDGISIRPGAGRIEIADVDVETAGGGQALFLGRGDVGALVEDVAVTGNASGAYGGRCAVRCDRDGTIFRRLSVDQPGDGYRRAIGLHADDCTIRGGEYRATHHPVLSSGHDIEIHEITSRSYDDYQAIKLLEGSAHVDISNSVLYEGILDQGTEDLDTWDNEYPDG